MSTWQTLLLGAIAGGTIFLGLPIGRVGNTSAAMRTGLTAFATGILIFLLWDVLGHGVEPVDTAVSTTTGAASPSWRRSSAAG